MNYRTSERLIGMSKVYQRGKTQIPSEVRKVLSIEDGQKAVWLFKEGDIVIRKA